MSSVGRHSAKEIKDSSNTMHLQGNRSALLKENTGRFLFSLYHEPAPRKRATSGMENTYSPPHYATMYPHKNHNPLEEKVVDMEDFMNQFLSWLTLNTGNPRGAMTASNYGFNNGADFEDEHVTIYIRLPSARIDPIHNKLCRDEWFPISTQHMWSSRGSPLCPAIVDPVSPHDSYLFCPPLSVGSLIFAFYGTCTATKDPSPPSAYVFYLDTHNVKGGWKEAPPLPPGSFHYYLFEANDKIYALGIFKGLSFDLLCLDCHDFSKGWQSIHPISNELPKQFLNDTVYAFKLKYDETPATCKTKRRATHAMIFLSSRLISYDFDKNAFKVYDDQVEQGYCWNCCTGVGHGDLVYFLGQINYNKPNAVLMVYNDSVHKWYPTPVVGLENFPHALPVSYERCSTPELSRARLFLIGEGRLCILWVYKTDNHNPVTPIYCTKFDVQVIDEKPFAVNVSTQLYTVRGPHSIGFDAVETMPQLQGRECTLAGPSTSCKKHRSKGRKGKGAKSKANKSKA